MNSLRVDGHSHADVAVIGSGIVGLSCAWQLMRRGLSCVLVDASGPGAQTSSGNAGSISVGNVLPQSTPGIAARGLRMLLDRDAPLKLDLPRLPHYAGWLHQFVRHGRAGRVGGIVDALHAINHASRAAWLSLADDIDANDLVLRSGYLHVYSRAESFADGAWERRLMAERGVVHRALDAHELRALEPGIGAGFEHALFQPEALALFDPAALCRRLFEALQARGARLQVATATALQPRADSVAIATDQGTLLAGRVVLAAGVWSHRLLRTLGLRAPIVPARGYHLMYPPQPDLVRRPTLWAERYMVVSPMQSGIRMTSIKELTAVGSRPRFGLIHRRDADARRLFPALASPPCAEWAGYRPCTPDSLPILDRIDDRIYLAAGHGHLGVTQGPVSGELIAQLLCGESPTIALAPYRFARFARAASA